MDGVRVVAWEPEHARPLTLVLGPPDILFAQARPGYGTIRPGPQWRSTLVAEVGGVPAGVAAVFAPRWHAQRLWVCVEVGECYRRRGIGSMLLGAARRGAGDDGRPLRGKVFSGSAGAGFAAAHGFTAIQRSRTIRLDGLAADTVSLKEITAARTARRRELAHHLDERASIVDRLLAVHRDPPPDPPAPEPEPDAGRPRRARPTLKQYREE